MKKFIHTFLIMTSLSCGAVANAVSYEIVVLAPEQGGNRSYASGINNLGDVAGYTEFSGFTHATLWFDSEPVNIHALGYSTRAYDINDEGRVAGEIFFKSSSTTLAAVWVDSSIQVLNPSGGKIGTAYSINAANKLTGFSSGIPGSGIYATIWDPSGYGHYFDQGIAYDINDADTIVGLSGSQPAEWNNGEMSLLATGNGDWGAARSVNNSGIIAGWTGVTRTMTKSATLWMDYVPTNLDVPGEYSDAYDINDSGVVVGTYYLNEENRGFLWDDGIVHDLDDLIDPLSGWSITEAVAINNNGDIAAQGYHATYGFSALKLKYIEDSSCPAEATLANQSNQGAWTAELRGVRDRFLRQSSEGRALIQTYYRHADEVTARMKRDPRLGLQALSVLRFLEADLKATLSGKPVKLTARKREAIRGFARSLQRGASPELSADLKTFLRKDLGVLLRKK